MKYPDGLPVSLGDIVDVPVPTGTARARVVMLGDTYEHLDIDLDFVSWVNTANNLDASSIVIEWLNENPLAHDDP